MKKLIKIFLLCALCIVGAVGAWAYLELRPQSAAAYASLASVAPKGPTDLAVRYLGTASLSFDDGETAIMEDGFFSRPDILSVVAGRIPPDDRRIDAGLRQAHIRRLAAIFVAHSHYDHAMDTGLVALKTGAVVLGSQSTKYVVEGAGLPDSRFQLIKDGSTFRFGRFKITVFETPHSPNPAYPGIIDHVITPPARADDYKLGQNYSFLIEHGTRRILVIGSGNFIPGKFKGVKADIVFLGISMAGKQGDGFVKAYWHEAVQQTGAKLVIPIHWDDFFQPLGNPLNALPAKLDDFDRTMKVLVPLARQDGVTLRLPAAYTLIDLDQR